MIQTFGVNDYETAEWISKTLGQATIEFHTQQQGTSTSGFLDTTRTQGVSQQLTGRALLTPDEVMHNPENEQILLVKGMPPVPARKLRYFEDKEFSGLYDQA